MRLEVVVGDNSDLHLASLDFSGISFGRNSDSVSIPLARERGRGTFVRNHRQSEPGLFERTLVERHDVLRTGVSGVA